MKKGDIMQNFIERFLSISAAHPDKTALVCMEEKMTYAQLERLSAKIASRLLRRGAEREKVYPIVLERGFFQRRLHIRSIDLLRQRDPDNDRQRFISV